MPYDTFGEDKKRIEILDSIMVGLRENIRTRERSIREGKEKVREYNEQLFLLEDIIKPYQERVNKQNYEDYKKEMDVFRLNKE